MSVSTYDPSAAAVSLTNAALQYFTTILAGQEGKMVCLSTKPSGCSGYAYVLDLVDASESDDLILCINDDVTLAIAADALVVVRGTEIDIIDNGINRIIKFNNPNVAAECGCGESFSIG